MELFVGDLSSCCTEEDLFLAFSQFGEVKHVRIQRSASNIANNMKGSLGYGFVKMGTAEQAEIAMTALNGVQIAGRNIRVKPASYRVEDSQKELTKTSVYVKYVGTAAGDFTNEEIIRNIYSTFGEVVDVTIRKEFVNAKKGNRRGYAFVHFPDTFEGAESALMVLNTYSKISYVNGEIVKLPPDDNHPNYGVVYCASKSKGLDEIFKALLVLKQAEDKGERAANFERELNINLNSTAPAQSFGTTDSLESYVSFYNRDGTTDSVEHLLGRQPDSRTGTRDSNEGLFHIKPDDDPFVRHVEGKLFYDRGVERNVTAVGGGAGRHYPTPHINTQDPFVRSGAGSYDRHEALHPAQSRLPYGGDYPRSYDSIEDRFFNGRTSSAPEPMYQRALYPNEPVAANRNVGAQYPNRHQFRFGESINPGCDRVVNRQIPFNELMRSNRVYSEPVMPAHRAYGERVDFIPSNMDLRSNPRYDSGASVFTMNPKYQS